MYNPSVDPSTSMWSGLPATLASGEYVHHLPRPVHQVGREGPPPRYAVERKGLEELDAILQRRGRAGGARRGRRRPVARRGGRRRRAAPGASGLSKGASGRGWGGGDAPAAEPASLWPSMGRAPTGRPRERTRRARRRRRCRWCRQSGPVLFLKISVAPAAVEV
jgi:hypothetical protein